MRVNIFGREFSRHLECVGGDEGSVFGNWE